MRVRFSPDIFRVERFGGVARYIAELHRELLVAGIDSRILAGLHRNAYLTHADRALGLSIEGVRPVRLRQAMSKVADRSLERLWAPAQDRGTIYHKTYFDRHVPTGPTLAVTVYDMIHERYPDQVSPRDVTPAAKRPWCERADVVFAISAHTRDDLVERFDLDPDRVVVTPLGVRVTAPDPSVVVAGGRPFVLYVGARGPRYKNFEGLARAYARSAARRVTSLVCFGGGPGTPAELELLAGLGLADTEFASGADGVLAAHYAQARAFIYPSHYEGFGLPPLEAMSHGCPVAAARVASIPDVVGEAAVLFDPADHDAMAGAIDLVVGDDGRRAQLIDAGRERVVDFSWAETAQRTIAGYERALAAPR